MKFMFFSDRGRGKYVFDRTILSFKKVFEFDCEICFREKVFEFDLNLIVRHHLLAQ